MDPIVALNVVTKIYHAKARVVALDSINLSVRRGELFGLLGPNGAGKTTTIGVCTTRTLPIAGEVSVAGIDVVLCPAVSTLERSISTADGYFRNPSRF